MRNFPEVSGNVCSVRFRKVLEVSRNVLRNSFFGCCNATSKMGERECGFLLINNNEFRVIL
jgi:hypothetical protein